MSGWNQALGKSNRAVEASERGLVTKSKITTLKLRKLGLHEAFTASSVKDLIDFDYISSREWHHTNATFFNCTDYYDLESIVDDINDDIQLYLEALDEIKRKKQEKKDDIIYADIVVTFVENIGSKRTPRYNIEKKSFRAKLKGYNKESGFVTIESYLESFRKSHKYIEIVNRIDFETYEKYEKKEALNHLRTLKSELLEASQDFNDSKLQKSIKYAKSISKLYTIKRDIKERHIAIEEVVRIKAEVETKAKREVILSNLKENLETIDFSDWLILPHELKHPAPQHIHDAKKDSGLSWTQFESFLIAS